jgi:hypothetical protein
MVTLGIQRFFELLDGFTVTLVMLGENHAIEVEMDWQRFGGTTHAFLEVFDCLVGLTQGVV